MTYWIKIYFYLIFYFEISAFPHINFHRTDLSLEHDCLYISIPKLPQILIIEKAIPPFQDYQEFLSFCLTEPLLKTNTINDQMLTFDELRKNNITSEQLYQWSASIDLIERYEEYLISTESSMSTDIFYNCT